MKQKNLLNIVMLLKDKGQKGEEMKSFKKILVSGTLVIALALGMVVPVNADTLSDDWNIDYTPGAPSSISNQSDAVVVNYDSGGYYADCETLSGQNGRALSIESSSAGGMEPVPVTKKGSTKTWKMKGSTTGMVTFIVSATSGYTCKSTGTIYVKGSN